MPRASRAARRAALLVLGSVAILCGCAADSSEPTPSESQAVLAGSGGRTSTQSCQASLGECTIGCDASYREMALGGRTLNDAHLKACKDACDAGYHRCTEGADSQRPNAVP